MGIQVQGAGGSIAGAGAEAAEGFHVLIKPDDHATLGHYRLSMTSGTMAAALGANSEIFQFRWPDASRFAVVYAVFFSAGANLAATAAGLFSARMTAARAWTVSGTGGTRATLTGDNQNLRTNMGASLVSDAGISTTAALVAGTKTLDAHDLGTFATGIGTGAITTGLKLGIAERYPLYECDQNGSHPLVLAQNEGFVVRTGAAAPATMTWHFSVDVVWSEVTAY